MEDMEVGFVPASRPLTFRNDGDVVRCGEMW